MKMILSRMCVITRKRKPRKELIKITRVDNIWYVDANQTMFGRSIYIDLNDATFNKFQKQQKRFKIEDDNFNIILNDLKELIAN